MVSATAAVSGGRSFAAQMAAHVLPLSFAMSQTRFAVNVPERQGYSVAFLLFARFG